MAFSCVPYGSNLTLSIYDRLTHFYQNTDEGCIGCLEATGKWFLVVPAHLLTSLIVIPALMIYDLAMTAFFGLLSLSTLFIIRELRERFVAHLVSFLHGPSNIRLNQVTGLCLPCFHRGNEILTEARLRH
jgi:hypothetical protein